MMESAQTMEAAEKTAGLEEHDAKQVADEMNVIENGLIEELPKENPTSLSEKQNSNATFPVEDAEWWKSTGQRIAYRNLCISIPCLLLAFATWSMWSMLVVIMKKTGYQFGVADLTAKEQQRYCYTLTSTAGMCGATFRLAHAFIVKLGGGRNVKMLTTGMLLLPSVLGGVLLLNPDVSIYWWILVASLAGLGGGNYASSMSNISYFFPKKQIGTALGLNAGLGNAGVFTALLVVSLVVKADWGLSDGRALTKKHQTLTGTMEVGEKVFPENGAFVWVPCLIVLTILAQMYMTNLDHVSPGSNTKVMQAYMKILTLKLFAFAGCAVGIAASMLSVMGGGWSALPFLVLPVVITVPIQLLQRFGPTDVANQFSIFDSKHTWIMSCLYTMTFGSYIGFSFAFGLLIDGLFGKLPSGAVDPEAPSPALYAPWGPLLGALTRPFGGWLADKVGSGSRVTTCSTLLLIVTTALAAVSVAMAKDADEPKDYFALFYLSFMGLFIGSGIGNGAVFRSVPYIFNQEKAGPVLGWISAIAAYGAFIIPELFKVTNEGGVPEVACWLFVAYYLLCLGLNWYYYDRPASGISC